MGKAGKGTGSFGETTFLLSCLLDHVTGDTYAGSPLWIDMGLSEQVNDATRLTHFAAAVDDDRSIFKRAHAPHVDTLQHASGSVSAQSLVQQDRPQQLCCKGFGHCVGLPA